MTRIWQGTVTVTNGSPLVTVSAGAPLSAANCPDDAAITLARATYHVAQRIDTTSLELTSEYDGVDATVAAEIDPLTPIGLSIFRVAASITDYNARLALLEAMGRGLKFDEAGTMAQRADYDGEPKNFAYLSLDGITPELFVKTSDDAGDWSDAVLVQGPIGRPGSGMMVAVTDEVRAIDAGAGKITFRAPNPMTLIGIRASLKTASSAGPVVVDVNVAGVSILSTKLSVDEGEWTSLTAATPAVISAPIVADDAEITIDIDSAGAGAVGLKVTFIAAQN